MRPPSRAPQHRAAPSPPRIGITRSDPSHAASTRGAGRVDERRPSPVSVSRPTTVTGDRHRARRRGPPPGARSPRRRPRPARRSRPAARGSRSSSTTAPVPEAAASRRTSVAMPSERSSMAVATAASARPSASRGVTRAVYPLAAWPPSVPVTTSRSPGRPPGAQHRPLGPADARSPTRTRPGAAGQVAAGERDAVLGHPCGQVARRRRSRRARRPRRAGTWARRPSPPCRTGSPRPPGGRCRAGDMRAASKWTPSTSMSVDGHQPAAQGHRRRRRCRPRPRSRLPGDRRDRGHQIVL